jgi:hypothetical protein
LSVGDHKTTSAIYDITDNPDYGICAKCQLSSISESLSTCPQCNHPLGPPSSYTLPIDPNKTPAGLDGYSYVLFEMHYVARTMKKIPLLLQGECPVVGVSGLGPSSSTTILGSSSSTTTTTIQEELAEITTVTTPTTKGSVFATTNIPFGGATNTKTAVTMTMHIEDRDQVLPFGGGTDSTPSNEGVIITEVGPNADLLKAIGLKPSIGDVVYSVDYDVVTHLNVHQLKRLLWRKYKEAKTQYSALGTVMYCCVPVCLLALQCYACSIFTLLLSHTYHTYLTIHTFPYLPHLPIPTSPYLTIPYHTYHTLPCLTTPRYSTLHYPCNYPCSLLLLLLLLLLAVPYLHDEIMVKVMFRRHFLQVGRQTVDRTILLNSDD